MLYLASQALEFKDSLVRPLQCECCALAHETQNLMETNVLPRHQFVRLHAVRHMENVADAAFQLWTQMAKQLISIIGDGGFDAIYDRSLYLTQVTYPWLGASSDSPQTDHRFVHLKTSLEDQSPALALAANISLLITFSDILASLVGESLTARILDSAWDHDGQINAAKELQK